MRRVFFVLFLAMLASCGGGNGDGGDGGDGDGDDDGGVSGSPPDVTLTATPEIVNAGGMTTLAWTSSPGTTSCTAFGGWTGALSTSGSAQSSQIYATTQFDIRCVNPAGGTTARTTVNVRPPQFTMTATPEVVQRGGKVTVRWQTRGMEACYADWRHPHEGPVNGSEEVDLADFGEYVLRWNFTMRCDGGGQSIVRTAPVRVKAFMGDVLFPVRVMIDADVNDPNAPLYQNDTLEDANDLSVHWVHVGYVNAPGQGPPGRSFAAGDVADFSDTGFFNVGELAGVRLLMPGIDMTQPVGERADADLYVYDSSGNLFDASVGSGQVESIELPGGDNYSFEVRAVTGGVNYMLELVLPPAVAGMHAMRVGARFLADEAIILPDALGRGALAPKAGVDLALRRLRIVPKAGSPAREMRVALPADDGAALQRLSPTLSLASPSGTRMTPEQLRKLTTLLHVKALAAAPGIRAASTNRIVDALATIPSDPLYVRQRWHYEMIGLPQAWDITTGAPGVTVAVVDSGVARSHPDLESRLAHGYDMVSDPANLDHDGIDPDFDDPGFPAGGSWIFHGTHVAGTIGAVSDNSVGVSGVTWGSSVMPIRALNGASGTMYDVLQGVRYAAGLENDSGTVPPRRADVINLSLGLSDDCESVEAATFTDVRAAGVMVVASAGNSLSNFPTTPASCPGVLSVASVGATGELAGYSNFGKFVDLAAPGGDFRFDGDGDGAADGVFSTHAARMQTDRTFTYEWLQGTSMAAPHVAGVLALMKSVNPGLQPEDVDQLLAAGAMTDDVLAPGRDDAGYGIINAFKAVRAATGDFEDTPRLVASPSVMMYQGGSARTSLKLTNGGGGMLSVTGVEASASWITITATSVDANGLGTYTVAIDRHAVPFAGQITGSIEIQTNAGVRHVPVIATDAAGFTWTNTPLYVIVTNAGTGEVVRNVRATDTRPFNAYRFDDLPPGRYVVVAGTDLDNDGNVCNPGEVCAAHPAYRFAEVVDYVDLSEGIDLPLVVTAKQFPLSP